MRRTVYERHGASSSAEYTAWENMKERCENPFAPEYVRYGKLGVRVCEEWSGSFLKFLAAVGPRPSEDHSLDRYPDRAGNYEQGNVRWATKKEQARNRKTCRQLTYEGKTLCLTEWSERTGIAPKTLEERLRRGWSVGEALTKPVGRAPANRGTRNRPRRG